MTPTKNQLDKWMPDQLKLSALTSMASTMRTKLDTADRKFDLPTTDWKGEARTAAESRSTEEVTWGKRVAAEYETLGTTLSDASTAIDDTLTAVDNSIADAAAKGFHLINGDDSTWQVRYVPLSKDDETTEEEVAQLRHEWATYLKGKADLAELTCQQYATAVVGSLEALSGLTPAVLGLSASDGRTAAMMSQDGWTKEELTVVGKSLEAAGLTPDQAQRLLNGERVDDLPVGAQEFLHQFFNNLSEDQTLALKDEFDRLGNADGEAYSKALGSGLLILSNEKIGAGDVHGGFGSLPPWMREWSTHRARDEWIVNQDGKPVNIARQDYKIAKLLSNTGGAIAPGERLGTELIRKAETEIAWAQHSPTVEASFPGSEVSDLKNNYQQTMENLLSVGTRSHEASAAILSGQYTDGTALDGDYDRNRTVENLLTHEWRDDGKTTATLTNWVDEYAADQTNASKSDLSARAFRGLLDSTSGSGEQFGNLINIGESEKSMGDINPALAGALEEAVRPYLNIMAGGAPGAFGFNESTFDDLNFGENNDALRDQSQRAMALIASDPTAGERLIHDVQTQQVLNAHNLVTMDHNDPDAPNAGEIGARNGALQNLLTDGLTAAELDNWHDDHLGSGTGTEGLTNDDRAAISSNVETSIKKVAAAIPVVGNTAEFGLDLASPYIPAWDKEIEPADQGPYPEDIPDAVENAQLQQYYQLYASTNPTPDGANAATDQRLFEGETLRPLNEITAKYGPGMENQILAVLRPRLEVAGVDMGSYDTRYGALQGDPTEAMSYDEYMNRLLNE